jgi:hypothetical protein
LFFPLDDAATAAEHTKYTQQLLSPNTELLRENSTFMFLFFNGILKEAMNSEPLRFLSHHCCVLGRLIERASRFMDGSWIHPVGIQPTIWSRV